MDDGVELTLSRRSKNELVPAEDLEFMTATEHNMIRQNRWFTTGLLSFLIAILLFINHQNDTKMTSEIDDSAQIPDTGEYFSGKNKSKIVSDAFSKMHHPHEKPNHWSKNHNSTRPKSDNQSSKVTEWLNATVTLRDGIKYEVVKQLYHDKRSFTEGLTYANGRLFESVGMNRQSALLELSPTTGETIARYDMSDIYFAEGLTFYDGKLYQLSYRRKTGFIYNVDDLSKPPSTFEFHTTTEEGWGLTYDSDHHEFIVSDGSKYLHFWNPDTLEFIRKVPVTRLDGSEANDINELEYWRGRVIANVWYRDFLLVINPATGMVEKEYDFQELWSSAERTRQGADVLNGISVSEDPDLLYLTGKYWDRMFLVRLLY